MFKIDDSIDKNPHLISSLIVPISIVQQQYFQMFLRDPVAVFVEAAIVRVHIDGADPVSNLFVVCVRDQGDPSESLAANH